MVKLGDLKSIESVILKLIEAELPIKVAFQINLMIDDFDKKITKLENFRVNLVKKYGKSDESGNLRVLPDNMQDFSKELKELLDSDVDFKPVKIPIDVFDNANIKITVKELNALIKVGFVDQEE